MRELIAITLCCFYCTAHADDLDVIVATDSTVEQRGEAYARIAKAEFPAMAPKLLALISTHPVLTGIGPRTKEPWKEEKLIPGDRIGCTLWQIWDGFTHATPQRGAHFPLFLDLLDYAPAGDARSIVISQLKSRLSFGVALGDKTLPPMAEILPRLDRLVRDHSYPSPLRRQLLEILFKYADPNEYLDLAIDLTREGTPIRQAEDFRFATPTDQASRFTPANRKKYVVHCYHLLQTIDDGHSGAGYFLATHIGHFLGVKPIVRGESPFKPDQRLPEYREDGGLKKSFFQDTVNNARKWWDEHKAEYQ